MSSHTPSPVDTWIVGYTGDRATTTNPVETTRVIPLDVIPSPDATSQVALKFDKSKVRMELLSAPALEAIAEVLTFGAQKYADNNWRKGFAWSRLFGALFRHSFAALRGEDRDPETGLLHMAHAGCCVMFILEHMICGLGTDDRHRTTGVNR